MYVQLFATTISELINRGQEFYKLGTLYRKS